MKKTSRKESRIATSPFPPQAHEPVDDFQWTGAPEMKSVGRSVTLPPLTFSRGVLISGNSVTDCTTSGPHAPIKEQTILGQLDESLKWASELDEHLAAIHARLLGRDPSCESDLPQTTVEGKSSALSTRLASMCGYAATMIQRIGEA